MIDDDGMPRIRSGLQLDNLNAVVEHNVNQENITCEAIKRSKQHSFQALEWFTHDSKKVYFSTMSTKIGDNLYKYESNFPSRHRSIKNNTIYKCCTILNGW